MLIIVAHKLEKCKFLSKTAIVTFWTLLSKNRLLLIIVSGHNERNPLFSKTNSGRRHSREFLGVM